MRSDAAAPAPTDADRRDGRESRIVAIVLVVTMGVWVGMQVLGGHYDWQVRYAFLLDFAAIAAFAWAMIVMVRMWRRQSRHAAK